MIKLLKHNQINPVFWDDCINKSKVNLPYALFDYLNIVSPKWGGIVFENEEKYDWVFPLPIKKKWGVRYLTQPLFTQQLGFYFTRIPLKEEKLQVVELLKKHFWLFDIADNYLCDTTDETNITQLDRLTHLLDLSKPIEEIRSGFNSNRKRILRSLLTDLTLESSSSVNKLLEMFEVDKGSAVIGFGNEAKSLLLNLTTNEKINDMFSVYYVRKKDEIIAGGLFIEFKDKLIFLFGATSPAGRKFNAMTYLFNEVINMFSNSSKILDFEGSTIDGVSRFYQSFGGKKVTFNQLKYSKIPFFVKNQK